MSSGTSSTQVTAQVGGIPSLSVDVPVSSVLLALFVLLAASHMTILQLNNKRKHKFLFSGLCFGFCMSRSLANAMRIAWAHRTSNVDIALVASIFTQAGILLVYIINNLLAWRLVRSAAPRIGWHPVLRVLNKVMLWLVLGMILPLIVIIVMRIKSPQLAHVGEASTVLTRLAQTYFLVLAVEPVFLIALAVHKGRNGIADPHGRGAWHFKVAVLSTTTVLAIIEAGFRCGTAWAPAPLSSDPAWWDSKAAFYCFNFVIDVLILTVFLVGRIDRRFHVPNKADGPGSYSRELSGGTVSSSVERKA